MLLEEITEPRTPSEPKKRLRVVWLVTVMVTVTLTVPFIMGIKCQVGQKYYTFSVLSTYLTRQNTRLRDWLSRPAGVLRMDGVIILWVGPFEIVAATPGAPQESTR